MDLLHLCKTFCCVFTVNSIPHPEKSSYEVFIFSYSQLIWTSRCSIEENNGNIQKNRVMRFLYFFIPSSNQWGTEDLKLLLLYLFSDNLLQKVESRMKLINLLNGKAKVNSDFISKVAHDILAYYEVTTNELICMCFEQKLIVRNINYVTCFCKKRI